MVNTPNLVSQTVQLIFKGKAFATPIQIGESWDWKPQTTYGHVSRGTFPVRLTNICGKSMVSLTDFVAFLNGETESIKPKPQVNPSKRKSGRPTKKEQAARARAAGGAQ